MKNQLITAATLLFSSLSTYAEEKITAHPQRSTYEKRVLALDNSLHYDDITWICSHNAMSNREENWIMPNQIWSITQQLEHGIHAQMWDIWMLDGKATLRHGNGSFFDTGKKELLTAFQEVKNYLDEHPRAIITLILESKVDDSPLLEALRESQLEPLRYKPTGKVKEWPTLGELRKSNSRLIILCDRRTEHFIQLWDHAVETDWVNKKVSQMNNRLRRGKAENALLILNHFVGNPFPSEITSKEANSKTILAKREKDIERLYKRRANYWTLDHIGCADALDYISKRLKQPEQRKEQR